MIEPVCPECDGAKGFEYQDGTFVPGCPSCDPLSDGDPVCVACYGDRDIPGQLCQTCAFKEKVVMTIEAGQQYTNKMNVPCIVVSLARHSETEDVWVIYTTNTGVYWALPATEFEKDPLAAEGDLEVFSVPLGGYRHFKGAAYQVMCRARDPRTLENVIIYENADAVRWIRPESMWNESVAWPDGVMRPRFTPIDKAPALHVELAPTTQTSSLSPYLDRILNALTHPEAFISDESYIGDFEGGMPSLEEVSATLGVPVDFSDSLVDVALRLRAKEKTSSD